jgi:hypothetical protein
LSSLPSLTLDEEGGCASHPGAEALVYILLHSGSVGPAAETLLKAARSSPTPWVYAGKYQPSDVGCLGEVDTMQTVEEIIEQARHLSPKDRIWLVEKVEESLVEEVVKVRPGRRNAAWSREMRRVVAALRKGAEGYFEAAIDRIVDDAVVAVRSEKQRHQGKARA